MPIYDVRCRACGTTFEVSRPMARADEPSTCPHGHDDTVRLLPTVGLSGRARAGTAASGAPYASAPSSPSATSPSGGGCCGGGCCS